MGKTAVTDSGRQPDNRPTLAEHLRDRKAKGFKPVPHYFQSGDFISHFIRDERCYAERVDELLTVYLSNSTGSLVGCKIKGVRRLLRSLKGFGISVESDNITLNYLFLAAAIAMPKSRTQYMDWAQRTKNQSLRRDELPWERVDAEGELAGV